jgi:plasmid stabilization system protein ParE
MSHSVHFTARALLEIDEALGWLANRSPAGAARWHEKLLRLVRSLEDNPERYGRAPESDWFPAEIRQVLHGKRRGMYRILFEVRGDAVYILRVRHGAQELLGPGEL